MQILRLIRRAVQKVVRALSCGEISLKHPFEVFLIFKVFGLDRGLPLDCVFIQRFLFDNSDLIVRGATNIFMPDFIFNKINNRLGCGSAIKPPII